MTLNKKPALIGNQKTENSDLSECRDFKRNLFRGLPINTRLWSQAG